jgi:arylsulfatase A-like enzyme
VNGGLLGMIAAGCAPRRRAGEDDTDAPVVPRGVLLLTADDLGWKDVGAYGLTTVGTPALDRLAAEGIAFDRAFDVTSTCSSSRATWATGQYPHTHGVTGLVHRHPELSLPSTTPHLARAFQDAGFVTALQGKWHLSDVEAVEDFGYDAYLDTDLDQVIRSADEARDFLTRHKNERFFLELNFMQTHRAPFFESFPQIDGFEVSPDDAPPPAWWGLPDWPEIREEVAGYMSRLAWMDAVVGDVLRAVDELGLADDTLVLFVSDNGPAFSGCKLTLYDRGLGTPLMVRWPRAIAASRSEALVSSVDLAPTLLDLAGLPPLPGAQGRSWRPLLGLGGTDADRDAVFAEMEQHGGPIPARSVRTERYKYIVNLSAQPWGMGEGDGAWREEVGALPDQHFDEPRPPEELFDLQADPLERTNLVGDAALATVLADLRARLRAHLEATADFRLAEVEQIAG